MITCVSLTVFPLDQAAEAYLKMKELIRKQIKVNSEPLNFQVEYEKLKVRLEACVNGEAASARMKASWMGLRSGQRKLRSFWVRYGDYQIHLPIRRNTLDCLKYVRALRGIVFMLLTAPATVMVSMSSVFQLVALEVDANQPTGETCYEEGGSQTGENHIKVSFECDRGCGRYCGLIIGAASMKDIAA